MCTGMTLCYQPCDHRTVHYSTKCTDIDCLQIRHFPVTFVNGYCIACMGSDHSSRTDSMKSIETSDTDVSSDVKAIGDKLDTLIQSCGAIAGVVNSEARKRASIIKPVKVVQFAGEAGLRASDIKIPINNTTSSNKHLKIGGWLTKDITAPITALQVDLDKHRLFWRNILNESIERHMAGKSDVKAMKEYLFSSYQWLDDHAGKAFGETEKLVALRCRERVYFLGSFAIVVFVLGFFFGVWVNNLWSRV